MDANQPTHFMIMVYDEEPPPAIPVAVSLCPGARHLNRVRLATNPRLITCRRCGELLDVIGLRPTTKKAGA